MNLKKIASKAADKAKENPELTLALLGMVLPGLVRKAGPVVVPIIVAAAGRR